MLCAAVALLAAPASAEKLRVGKVVAQNFGFVPLNVGVETGIYKKLDLDIDEFDFGGGAKQQQAIVAGSIDIAIGGGTDFAFVQKGSPSLAVAAITSSPAFMGYIVGADVPAKSLDDLKGKKIGVTTAGSLTRWLVDQLNRAKGWGADGAVPIPIGGELATEVAALKTHQVDAFVDSPAIGYQLETEHAGRLLATCDVYIKNLQVFIIYAHNALIAKNPDAVKRFLAGWFQSVAYMKSHKAETVEIARKITGFSKPVEEREYDLLMPHFSTDGKFDKAALAATAQSFVDLKMLDAAPDMSKLYTERFLP
jgi:ABC-type nitrate/sulfonate/bicarbonate transport system substrate-binding protein